MERPQMEKDLAYCVKLLSTYHKEKKVIKIAILTKPVLRGILGIVANGLHRQITPEKKANSCLSL